VEKKKSSALSYIRLGAFLPIVYCIARVVARETKLEGNIFVVVVLEFFTSSIIVLRELLQDR